MCGPSVGDCRVRGGRATPSRLPCPSIVQAAGRFGIKTEHKVLSENEKNGHEKTPATEAAEAAVDEVWGWLTKYNLTNGLEKPVRRLLPRRDERRQPDPGVLRRDRRLYRR